MAKKKVEVILKGEFTTIDIFLEGIEIPLNEINNNDFYKLYNLFEIEDPLDIHVRLKGWIDMNWEIIIKINNATVFSKHGTFDYRGFITFTETIKLQS
jgi:hypothetical protein